MANGTWLATGLDSGATFSAADNWLGNTVAIADGTITLASTTAPTLLRPTTGTYNFVVALPLDVWVNNWLETGGNVGTVLENNGGAIVEADNPISLTVQVGLGEIYASGNLILAGGSGRLIGADLDGQISATADSTMDWAGYNVAGSFDAGGKAITHSNATGTLTCDTAGNLDLGAAVATLSVVFGAVQTVLTRNLVSATYTLPSGTVVSAANVATLASGTAVIVAAITGVTVPAGVTSALSASAVTTLTTAATGICNLAVVGSNIAAIANAGRISLGANAALPGVNTGIIHAYGYTLTGTITGGGTIYKNSNPVASRGLMGCGV
jgi:hypothetical protein